MSLRTFWPALLVVPWGVAAVSLLQNNHAFTTGGLLCMGVFGLLFLVMAFIRIICRRRQIKLESTIEVSDGNVATRLLGALGTLEYLLLKLDASEHYRLRTMLWDVIDSISLTSTDVEATLGQFEENLRNILMSRHISLR